MSAQFPIVIGEDRREMPARFLMAEQLLTQQPTAVEVHIYHTSGTITKVFAYDAARQGWFYEFSAAEIATLGFGTWKCRFKLTWADGRVRFSPTNGKDTIKVEAEN
jgi:hypothetical protein